MTVVRVLPEKVKMSRGVADLQLADEARGGDDRARAVAEDIKGAVAEGDERSAQGLRGIVHRAADGGLQRAAEPDEAGAAVESVGAVVAVDAAAGVDGGDVADDALGKRLLGSEVARGLNAQHRVGQTVEQRAVEGDAVGV